MTLLESLLLAVVNTLFFGLVLAVLAAIIGFLLNMRLERLKGAIALANKAATPRAEAYASLWQQLAEISPRDFTDIAEDEQARLLRKFREWYYREGNGMYLSLNASDLFLTGLKLLEEGSMQRSKAIRSAFSALRTQMKIDVGVYSQKESEESIPRDRTVRKWLGSTSRSAAADGRGSHA